MAGKKEIHGYRGQYESAQEPRLRAFELRKQGLTYRAIGAAIGVSHTQAHEYVQSVLDELEAMTLDEAKELRRIEIERLETAISAIWPAVQAGHLLSIDRYTKLSERLSKLTGLDAPAQVQSKTQLAVEGGDAYSEMIKKIWQGKESDAGSANS